MSLPRRDRRTLRETARSLTQSDPGLASMLALFNQLAGTEPARGRQQAPQAEPARLVTIANGEHHATSCPPLPAPTRPAGRTGHLAAATPAGANPPRVPAAARPSDSANAPAA